MIMRISSITFLSFSVLFCMNALGADIEQCPLELEGPLEPVQDMFCGENPQVITFEVINTSGTTPIDISLMAVFSAGGNTSSSTTTIISDTCNGTVPPMGNCFLDVEIIPVECEDENFPQQIVRDVVIVPHGFPSTSASFSLQVNEALGPLVAAGTYEANLSPIATQANPIFPLLFVSNDLGNTWNYKVEYSTNLPTDFVTNGIFIGTDCEQDSCVAVGDYSDETKMYPMIITSSNRGVNWEYTIDKSSALPLAYKNDGILFNVDCVGDICITNGEYTALDNKIYPLLAVSRDAGQSWEYQVDKKIFSLPSEYNKDGFFNDIDCEESLCAAAGKYKITLSNQQFPMLLFSKNSAVTWQYPIDSTSSTLPDLYNRDGEFSNVGCTENICAASGTYLSNVSRRTLMLAVSVNNNQNWDYVIESGNNPPSDYFDSGLFSGMSCDGNSCVAVGEYRDANTRFPMLVASLDDGVTWNYKVDKANGLPDDFLRNGMLANVNCSGGYCVATGSYTSEDDLLQYPILLTSDDAGDTWDYEVKSNLNLPDDYGDTGGFSNVSCDASHCAATGFYVDEDAQAFPMFIVTTDFATWDYQISKDKHLPNNYLTIGGLFTVSCSTEVCMTGGRYLDTLGGNAPMLLLNPEGGSTYDFVVDSANHLPIYYVNNGYFGASDAHNIAEIFFTQKSRSLN